MRKVELEKAITERDQANHALQEARSRIHDLTQQLEATKYKYNSQEARLVSVEREVKKKTDELKHAEAKQQRLLKAIKAVQRDRKDMIANLRRQYDDHAAEYFALVEAEWRAAARELALAKQDRDESQRTLADCARVIKSLNSTLNSENGSA
ncbi:hypothetical protein ONZ43_g2499 [Nemania bipapillata]|uniref:Uncharacterized protein n=1 Tax=Nemania bipapillata TaxID=110536 RepID=A0ACC2J0E1_9PEZI|nr:hypothetical protein ONZ43_g2499 [Nemania bipapillata]